LTYFIITFLFVIIAISVALIAHRCFSVAFPFTLLSFIVLSYFIALFGYLPQLKYVFALLVLISLIYIVYQCKLNRAKVLQVILTPGFYVILVLTIANYFWNDGRLLSIWDEFSHWGLTVKNMHYFNTLAVTPESTTFFKDYVPGASLFIYFYNSFSTLFNEPQLYMAFNVLKISLLLPVLKNYDGARLRDYLIPASLLILIPFVFFNTAYRSLYVDAFLGMLFAYALYSYYSELEDSNFMLANLTLACIVLVITKHIGFYFAAISIIVIVADSFVRLKGKSKHRLLKLMVPLSGILVAYGSWSLFLAIQDVPGSWNTSNLTLNSLIGLFYEISEYRRATIINFVKSFIPYLHMALLFAGLTYVGNLYCFNNKKFNSKRIIIFIFGILFGLATYSSLLLLSYLFAFSEYEAQRVASFDRYMNSYSLGAALILAYLFIEKAKDNRLFKKFVTLYLIFHLIIVAAPSIFSVHRQILAAQNKRSDLAFTQYFSEIMDYKKDRVYFISQGSNGFDYWVFRFNITPVKTNENFTWSLRSEAANNIWASIISPEEWFDILITDYTYLYLHKVDEHFIDQYGNAFKNPEIIKNNTLFSIVKTSNSALLKKVD
jgi:hypothetical protein